MDFKGIITESSSFNLIMKTATNQECFIMGKRTDKTFCLYVGAPMTLVQGFGIFIANFLVRK